MVIYSCETDLTSRALVTRDALSERIKFERLLKIAIDLNFVPVIIR